MFKMEEIDLIRRVKCVNVYLNYFGKNIRLGDIYIDENMVSDYIRVIDYYYNENNEEIIKDVAITYTDFFPLKMYFPSVDDINSFYIGFRGNKFKNKIINLYNDFIDHSENYIKNKDKIKVKIEDFRISNNRSMIRPILKIFLEVDETLSEDLKLILASIAKNPFTGNLILPHKYENGLLTMEGTTNDFKIYFDYNGVVGRKTVLSKAIMNCIEEFANNHPELYRIRPVCCESSEDAKR